MLPAIAGAIAAVDPSIPRPFFETQSQRIADGYRSERFFATASGAFGLLALLVAMTGSSYNAVPAKDIAELMGHAAVNMQLTYIQTMDTAKRSAVEKIASELARIGQFSDVSEKTLVVN